MDFLMRNLEALGDEVAAALDDLADEVTGRNKNRIGDADDTGGSVPSDDCNLSSASDDAGGHGYAASDGGSDDTASCHSDAGAMVPPMPARPPEPASMGVETVPPATQAVKTPSPGLRRRKPLLDGRRMATDEAATAQVPAVSINVDAEVIPDERTAPPPPTTETASPATAPPATAAVAATDVQTNATVPSMPEAAAPAPVPTEETAASAADDSRPGGPCAPPKTPSSGFDLCDRDAEQRPRTPAEDGEFLVL